MISQRLSDFLMFELFLMMGAIISERQAMIYLNPVEQADIFFFSSWLNFELPIHFSVTTSSSGTQVSNYFLYSSVEHIKTFNTFNNIAY